jgi:integrase
VIGKMPISLDKGKPLTERQKEIVEGIKKGMKEGKTNSQTASELGISEPYVNDLKMRAGLTKTGSVVREWIEENSEVRDWLREIRGGEAHESTKKGFAGSLKKYCEFRGLTPAEILDEAEEDLKLERRKRRVKTHLLDFKDYLKETGRGKTTVGHYMSAINSFFTSHDVFLPKLSNGSREVEWEKEEFDREKVRELVNVCNPREKAMFLTMFQSGLAANELSSLRIRDLKDVKDDITVLRLQRQKNGYRFITFLGRDARAAIEHYLKIRNEGALIPTRPNLSRGAKVESEDDFLFITYDSHVKQWNKIDTGHVSKYMMQACKKLGWYNGEKRNPWRPHALRASFATILNNNGVPKNFVDFMLGHKPGQTDEAYFKAHFDTMFKYYKDSEHLLSISELEKVPDSKYEELMIDLHKRNGEVKELKERMESLEKEKESMKAKEEAMAPYDDKMTELMKRLIANPELKKLIKEEFGEIKGEKA